MRLCLYRHLPLYTGGESRGYQGSLVQSGGANHTSIGLCWNCTDCEGIAAMSFTTVQPFVHIRVGSPRTQVACMIGAFNSNILTSPLLLISWASHVFKRWTCSTEESCCDDELMQRGSSWTARSASNRMCSPSRRHNAIDHDFQVRNLMELW